MENKIEQRCNELGVTQRWLSVKSGVPESTVSEIKSGQREPAVSIAILLSRALGCAVEDLFIVP